jgi:prophage antirepressor-like protein
MSDEKVKILKYNGVDVVFVPMSGSWLLAAKNFGNCLGYHGKGHRLVASIGNWLKKSILIPIVNPDQPHLGDVYTATGPHFHAFWEAAGGSQIGTGPETGLEIVVLSLQGASKILMRANTPAAKKLRNRWEEVTSALMNNKDMPLFISEGVPAEEKKKTKKRKSKQREMFNEEKLNSKKSDLEELAAFMQKARDMADCGNISMPAAQAVSLEAMKGYAAKKWPNAIMPSGQGSSGQRRLPAHEIHLAKLPYGQPLPAKWKGFIHATEIGKPVGLNARQVGQYLKDILQGFYGEKELRANKLAQKHIGCDKEKQDACFDQETEVSTYDDNTTTGGLSVALFVEDADGESHWTTYWRVDIARWITAELGKIPKVIADMAAARAAAAQMPMAQAPAPFAGSNGAKL